MGTRCLVKRGAQKAPGQKSLGKKGAETHLVTELRVTPGRLTNRKFDRRRNPMQIANFRLGA
jgi:hypothetical protein